MVRCPNCSPAASKSSAPVTLEEAERSHILQTLQQTEGVVGGRNGAAARLGLPRTTLISKMKRLGINRSYFEFAKIARSSDRGELWHAQNEENIHEVKAAVTLEQAESTHILQTLQQTKFSERN